MVERDAKILAEKYERGECTEEELALIEGWYLALKEERVAPDYEKIETSMDQVWRGLNVQGKPLIKLWPRLVAAVAAVAVVVFGVFFFKAYYMSSRHPEGREATRDLSANDIAPGRNVAKLKLANGRVITLSDAKTGLVVVASSLKYNDGSAIAQGDPGLSSRSATGQAVDEVVMSTPRGGTYQIVLPDGSKVWLNAASSITFPSSFSKLPKRVVELSGEAYFEVFKNKNQPFIVKSKGQQVEVLGTHFNINSYADEGSVKTTLLEGSVNVNGTILKPNQQAVLNHNTITVEQADAAEIMAWKDGLFRFNNENIASIMLKLSRWYNIDVVYQNIPKPDGFTGTISRFKNISQVLKMLSETESVKFKVEGRRVTVIQ
ncbi:hypothetical protein HDC92_005030 [Pedobacter sp. AK017]|uniref:FecR family protein n=1 Tax=Pedobacter sp. AK017 TaxID=2723073 RepID=UPI00161706D1|nr:FecR family protein [Pedobacter sp. AK017]MBB5441322.1 hypothetical protein [Pedobacter sp. AK017]